MTTQVKLNPVGTAKINFPGFQKIADFTSTGSESTFNVTVDSDVDKEYHIYCRDFDATDLIYLRLNGDSGNNYGAQYIDLTSSVTSARGVNSYLFNCNTLGIFHGILLTPTGLIKTMFQSHSTYASGTTISSIDFYGRSWNNTAKVTSLNFLSAAGNWAAGTRIVVYARRSQV